MARGDDDGATGRYGDGSATTRAMADRFRRCRTVMHFNDWVQAAQPGARQVYGFGVSAATAAPPGVADRMRVLSDAGLVLLVQRRVSRFDGDRDHPFDYIAIRSHKPCPARFPDLIPVRA